MKEGFWLNYRTGRTFLIHEHEIWLREPGNARKLGVPKEVIAEALERFRPFYDRVPLLLFVMERAPVMRIRGHGHYVTFEYHARADDDATLAVRHFAGRMLGPMRGLHIVNLAKT